MKTKMRSKLKFYGSIKHCTQRKNIGDKKINLMVSKPCHKPKSVGWRETSKKKKRSKLQPSLVLLTEVQDQMVIQWCSTIVSGISLKKILWELSIIFINITTWLNPATPLSLPSSPKRKLLNFLVILGPLVSLGKSTKSWLKF